MCNFDKNILIIRLKEKFDSGEDWIYEYKIETIYGYADSTSLYTVLPNTNFTATIYYDLNAGSDILRIDNEYNAGEFLFLYRLKNPDCRELFYFPKLAEQNEAWVRSIEILDDILSNDKENS